MTGHSKGAILKLLAEVGQTCMDFHDRKVRDVRSRRIQCDEIWAFCYAKEKNVPKERKGIFGFGDVWTWTAIDADTKLCISWTIGNRDGATASAFVADLAERLAHRVQLTTDGHKVYLNAVEDGFGGDIDYAHKALWGNPRGNTIQSGRMYRV